MPATLPTPLLVAIFLLIIIAGGFGRRIAGGLGNSGSTLVSRIVQATIAGLSAAVLIKLPGAPPQPLWWAPCVGVLTFAGACWGFPSLRPRWPFVDFGTSNMVPRGWLDTLALSLNGVAACAPLALGAWLVGLSPWWFVLAGLARGPAYWLAAAYLPLWRWIGFEKWVKEPIPRWVPMPTALTEFYSGCALHAALIATLCL